MLAGAVAPPEGRELSRRSFLEGGDAAAGRHAQTETGRPGAGWAAGLQEGLGAQRFFSPRGSPWNARGFQEVTAGLGPPCRGPGLWFLGIPGSYRKEVWSPRRLWSYLVSRAQLHSDPGETRSRGGGRS